MEWGQQLEELVITLSNQLIYVPFWFQRYRWSKMLTPLLKYCVWNLSSPFDPKIKVVQNTWMFHPPSWEVQKVSPSLHRSSLRMSYVNSRTAPSSNQQGKTQNYVLGARGFDFSGYKLQPASPCWKIMEGDRQISCYFQSEEPNVSKTEKTLK